MDENMQREWNAWQEIVGDLKRSGIDVNAPESAKMVRHIKAWGECLAILRRDQSASVSREVLSQLG